MKRILDPEFRYVPSFDTDVRKTFERIRREQQQKAAEPAKVLRLQSVALQGADDGLDARRRVG